MRVITCSACGEIGHAIGPDGMCSRRYLAARYVGDGVTQADAAELHGTVPTNVSNRIELERKQPPLLEMRLQVIRRRHRYRERQLETVTAFHENKQAYLIASDTTGIYLYACEPLPRIDTSGAEHAELPDQEPDVKRRNNKEK